MSAIHHMTSILTAQPMERARAKGEAAGKACEAKAQRIASYDVEGAKSSILAILCARGATPGEALVDLLRIRGFNPHDGRAFGPVFASLAKAGEIVTVGYQNRKRGKGAAGCRIWDLATNAQAKAQGGDAQGYYLGR